MNNKEARTILLAELAGYCSYAYSDLRQLLRTPYTDSVTGPSGTKYQIEVVLVWEDSSGELVIQASIDDGGWRAFSPLTEGFTMSRDGSVAAGGDLGELMSLRQGITQAFCTSGVSVNISNGQFLTVTLSDSPAGELQDSEQRGFAREVAQYVRDNYTGYGRLESVSVRFAKVVGEGPMKFTVSTVPCSFTGRELGCPTKTSKGPTQ